jgi:hypothetical protein
MRGLLELRLLLPDEKYLAEGLHALAVGGGCRVEGGRRV